MTPESIAFLDPWEPLATEQVESFSSELTRELTSTHPLYGLPLTPIARSTAADDALFSINSEEVTMVHLTWSGRPENPPWPIHKRYPTLQSWVREVMGPDHAEYAHHRSSPRA